MLHYAAMIGNTEIAQYLLDQRHCEINARDDTYNIPLYYALVQNQPSVSVILLRKNRIDLDASITPLHSVMVNGERDEIEALAYVPKASQQ